MGYLDIIHMLSRLPISNNIINSLLTIFKAFIRCNNLLLILSKEQISSKLSEFCELLIKVLITEVMGMVFSIWLWWTKPAHFLRISISLPIFKWSCQHKGWPDYWLTDTMVKQNFFFTLQLSHWKTVSFQSW